MQLSLMSCREGHFVSLFLNFVKLSQRPGQWMDDNKWIMGGWMMNWWKGDDGWMKGGQMIMDGWMGDDGWMNDNGWMVDG